MNNQKLVIYEFEELYKILIEINNYVNLIIKKASKNDISDFMSQPNILILTHNVVLRCLIGSKFGIKMKDWFKININYFDLLEFRLEKNKLRPNINRIKFLDIFSNIYLK